MKTTTQQQMTTERNALGLSLLAGSWLGSFRSTTAAALARTGTDALHRLQACFAQLLAALCPASQDRLHRRHCQPAFSSGKSQFVYHIRGGNP